MQNTLRNGTVRGRVGPGFSDCAFPSRSIKALGFEIKGILQSAVHRKHRVPFSPEAGQGCRVIKKEKGREVLWQESPTFPTGTEKEHEVRQGHLAEPSDSLLHTFWSEPSSPVTQAGSLGSPRSRLQRGGQIHTADILVCPETLAPPNEHPSTARGRAGGRRRGLP